MKLLPSWVLAVLVLLLPVLAGVGYMAGVADGAEQGAQRVQVLWDAQQKTMLRAAAEAESAHRELERQAAERLLAVEEDHATFVERAAADAAGAHRELERLRRDLAARRAAAVSCGLPAAASAAGLDAGATEAELFGACASQLVELAGETDRIAGQLRAFQALIPP